MSDHDSLFEKAWQDEMAALGHTKRDDPIHSGSLTGLNRRAVLPFGTIDAEGLVAYPLRDEPKGGGPPTPGSANRIASDDFTDMTGRMEWRGKPAAIQDRSLAPFNIRGFRNNQLFGDSRLPVPSRVAGGGTIPNTGILSLQRNIRGPHREGKPRAGRRATTVGAANLLPLQDPRIQIDRNKQLKTWAGDKNEHLWSAGNLDHDVLQQLMAGTGVGDESPDVGAMAGMGRTEVGRGPFGDAMLYDADTGIPLPHLAYSVFDLKDESLEPHKGRWRPENRAFRDEDAGQDWRDTVTGPASIGGQVTGSIDPVLRIPMPDGSGYVSHTDDSGHEYSGVPVPMNMAAHAGDLGMKRGVGSGSKGIFFRPEDLTDEGLDVFNTALRGNVIQLSEDEGFEEAWDVAKGNTFDDTNWGMPGKMFFWEKLFGGKMPDSVKYPWNKDKEGNYGPARPEGQMWGGGARDIIDFANTNPQEVETLTGSKEDPNLVDYPLGGMEIPKWTGSKEEAQSLAGFGNPGKMPGISVGDMPIHACTMKTAGACDVCYAAQNKMGFNNAQAKYHRNLFHALNDMPQLISAIQDRMGPSAMAAANWERDALPHLEGLGYLRHKASGDFRGPGEVSAYIDLLQQQTPAEMRNLNHWISSRQYPFIREAMDARGGTQEDIFPDNTTLRVSLPPGRTEADYAGKGGKGGVVGDIASILENPAVSTSGFIPKEFKGPLDDTEVCPASVASGGAPMKCDEVIDPTTGNRGCRRCWRKDEDVQYREHGESGTSALEEAWLAMQPRQVA